MDTSLPWQVDAERRAVLAARLAGFVTWEIDAETLRIVYDTGLANLFGLEPGQSAESILSVKKGFGSQLTRLGVTGQLGGSISHDWQPTGVVIKLVVPLPQLET